QENKGSQGFQKFGSPAGGPSQLPPESSNGNGQHSPAPVTKMGPPESGSTNIQPQPPASVAKLGPPEQQQDKSGDASKQKSGSNKSSQGWQKFGPPAG